MNSRQRRSTATLLTLALAFPCATRGDLLAVSWFGDAWIIDETTAEVVASAPTGFFQLNSLARDSQGRFFTVGSAVQGDVFADQILLMIDPMTGIASPVAPLPLSADTEGTVRALAFSPDDVLYATVRTPFSDGVALLCTIDVATGATTLIGSTSSNYVQGMAFSPDGILYGLDGIARLGIIDVTVGTITPVANAPRNRDLNSLGFGPTGILYAAGNDFPELYTLDTGTGEATLVGTGEFSDLRGLDFIPDPVTFESTANDILLGLDAEQVDNAGIAKSLLAKLAAAADAAERGQSETAVEILIAFVQQVESQAGLHLSQDMADLLLEDVMALLASLSNGG